jgi:hypothetical protein
MKKLFVLLSAVVVFTSCTENQRAKQWGGTEEISLNKNEIVLNVTWKETEMWICTKDTTTGITYFREKSNWGMMEGTVILK